MHSSALAIWAFVKNENPTLYSEFLLKAKHTNRIRLFGFIPFLTIVKQANRTKVYLFEKLPLFTSKETVKMEGRDYEKA